MDLADGGDLQSKINSYKKKGSFMPEKEVWRYFLQIVAGVEALHNLKIVHRDIKCANLFLTQSGILKLGDLNVSKVIKMGLLHTQTGTPYYASPEVWQDKPYDYKSDIWSIGCVLYELCAQVPPFRAPDMKGLFQKVIRGSYPPIPAMYSQDLALMIKALLQVNPSNRPSCTRILTMPGTQNHFSETLVNQLDSLMEETKDGAAAESISLLDTIKVPRNLGLISERLPKANYNSHSGGLKRNISVPSRLGQLHSQREALLSARPSQAMGGQLEPIREVVRSAEREGGGRQHLRADSADNRIAAHQNLYALQQQQQLDSQRLQMLAHENNKENLRLPRINEGRNYLQKHGSAILGGVIQAKYMAEQQYGLQKPPVPVQKMPVQQQLPPMAPKEQQIYHRYYQL